MVEEHRCVIRAVRPRGGGQRAHSLIASRAISRRQVTPPEEAAGATQIIAFNDVPAELKGNAKITFWSDVPPATKHYNGARNVIVRHLTDVVGQISSGR